MITYKPIIIQGGRRRDGTWPVKIRVTFKGKSRRLPTTLVCTDQDLTRGGRIKNATTLARAGELIASMRATCDSLSPFTLEAWSVDDVVRHIRDTLASQAFRLDFFAFSDRYLEGRSPGTAAAYRQALGVLERYLGRRELDVNAIDRRLLLSLSEWVEAEPWQRYVKSMGRTKSTGKPKRGGAAVTLARLGHLFAAAKYQYNDEDSGRIVIPRSPFTGLRVEKTPHQGAHPLPVEAMQAVIDDRPTNEVERIARAAFLLSFATMGANMADLYTAKRPGRVWRYYRTKTASRRADRAEVRCIMTDEALALALELDTGGEWWLGALHRWPTAMSATAMVGRGLHRIAARLGLEPFTFYSARKTWATLARRLGVEKATVDEALGHVGDYRLADIYAERNWELPALAHRQVMDLFNWAAPRPATEGPR